MRGATPLAMARQVCVHALALSAEELLRHTPPPPLWQGVRAPTPRTPRAAVRLLSARVPTPRGPAEPPAVLVRPAGVRRPGLV